MTLPQLLLLAALATPPPSAAAAPGLQHYIYFNRDRVHIHDAAFLGTRAIAGAEIKYTWAELEARPDEYTFAPVLEDLVFLEAHGKRLVVQLQDASFDERVNIPDYLVRDSSYHGGAARKYEAQSDDDSKVRFDGWVARRWDPAVQARFARLLEALAKQVDGRIEALVLSETAVEFGTGERYRPAGFTFAAYAEGVKAQLRAARAAFTRSRVIQYANFMPGEWLPKTDHGYLRGVYALADSVRAGVGGPDLIPGRKELRTHSYPLIAARHRPDVVAGIAVQHGNLAAKDPVTGRPVTVPDLVAFARDSLKLDYIFWGTQEPYFSRDVLPWLAHEPPAATR